MIIPHTWYVPNVFVRDMIGAYTQVVLKDLNDLADKYLWRKNILDDIGW